MWNIFQKMDENKTTISPDTSLDLSFDNVVHAQDYVSDLFNKIDWIYLITVAVQKI